MAKKILKLTDDDIREGITEKVLVGKSMSQLIFSSYDTSTDNGIRKGIEALKKCTTPFSTKLDDISELCVSIISNYLSHTNLNRYDSRYRGFNLKLSDCFSIESDVLVHFGLNFHSYPDESNKLLSNETLWKVNVMNNYKDGREISDVYIIDRAPLNSQVMESFFKLEHDSFPSLAAEMLWDIRIIKNSSLAIERRLEAAYSLGRNNTLFYNYARTSNKQRERAKLTRKETLNSIYNQLRAQKAGGEKPEDLWPVFIGYLDSNPDHFDQLKEQTPNKHNKKTWYLTYLDDNGKQNTIKYETFQKKLRNPAS